jgi:hypothetical protein
LSALAREATGWGEDLFWKRGLVFMASGNDMDSAKETYTGFASLMKWGTISAVVVAAVVVVLISS